MNLKYPNLLLSVVIPHGCIDRSIIQCVSSVSTQSLKRENYEIIVVLDGLLPDLKTLRELSRLGCKVIQQEKAGVCTTRNNGIVAAESELIVLIDDDCIADERLLEEYYIYFLNNKNIVGAGGIVLPMEGTNAIAKYAEYRKLLSKPVMKSNEVLTIITANGAFRKNTLIKVGLFETRLDSYFGSCGGDDVDLSFKLKEAGYKLGFCSEAIVSHKHREKLSALFSNKFAMEKAYMLILI
jgi:mycofactocin glycosyltransferase